MYQTTLQKIEGLVPIIALISHENRLTPRESWIAFFSDRISSFTVEPCYCNTFDEDYQQ